LFCLCSEERSPVEIVKEVQVQRTDDQKEEEQPALGKNEQNFSNYVKKIMLREYGLSLRLF